MKTLMTLLLTLAILFTLAACGSQAGGDQTQEPNQSDVLDGDVSGGEEENRLCAALTERANALGLRWSYHYESGMARAILEGPPEAIAALLSHLT